MLFDCNAALCFVVYHAVAQAVHCTAIKDVYAVALCRE